MNLKILIVDDEKEITTMLDNYLTLEGYEVDTCNDPIEAYERFESGSYSVVISDISMPGMTGVELLEKIKKYDELTQVIMITGYVTMDNILTAFRHGANNVFFKPFQNMDLIKEELSLAIKKLLRIKDVLKELSKAKK